MKLSLNQNYDSLLQKFKNRQDQTSLEEALVYLKLRQYNCANKSALVFAKKKQKGIDGTIQKDGPPGFKKLVPYKPNRNLTNGWLRGQKLKYQGTIGYSEYISKNELSEKKEITDYNHRQRQRQQNLRRQRTQSLVKLNIDNPKEAIDRIGMLKQDASKQREFRNIHVEYRGVKLDQTTKQFYRDTDEIDENGLIMKLGVFNHLIGDKHIQLTVDQQNLKGKSLTNYEVDGSKKRDEIMKYQKTLSNFKEKSSSEPNLLTTYGNSLMLSNNKKLKQMKRFNSQQYGKFVKKSHQFYNNMQKSIKIQFLEKRKYPLSIDKLKKKNTIVY